MREEKPPLGSATWALPCVAPGVNTSHVRNGREGEVALRGSIEGGGSSAPGAARRAPSTTSSLAAVAELTERSGGASRVREALL